ncbi:hypothetical protein [Subtercola lobariae]|uniref:Uncharacterized protein n=1 Tax=Subtercola lobariae TaxID=1588641 RepID=A0A917AZL6_9MICO|nr:hypothetical protein [Subtercola lobariae]GGF11354.1 hypothetical protein GCM10011399_01480 [Subtercola lobariae]
MNHTIAPPTDFPECITLSPRGETFIEQLGVALIVGTVSTHQLSPALLQFWEFGVRQGERNKRPEIDQANADANRLYALHFNPRTILKVGLPFPELENIREAMYAEGGSYGGRAA